METYIHNARARRRWLLEKALETKRLPEALALARAVERFLQPADEELDWPEVSIRILADAPRRRHTKH